MFIGNNDVKCTVHITWLYILLCEIRFTHILFLRMRINKDPHVNVQEIAKRLTSLRGSPCDICCCSSFCSSFRAPIDCWFLTKSESSLSPASVKYLAKCSQLRLFAGNNSWKKHREAAPEWNPLSSGGFVHSFPPAQGITFTWNDFNAQNERIFLIKGSQERIGWTRLQLSWVTGVLFVCVVILTMSLLSMPTFRRLAATEPISFSDSHDLKSFTAKHAETPE